MSKSRLDCARLAALLASCVLFSPTCLPAQQPAPAPAPATTADSSAPQKIAFIDIERIVEDSAAIRKAMETMDSELAAMAREIDAQEREFRRQRFDLDKQERVLSETEKTTRRESLSSLREEIDRRKFDFELQMRSRERQLEPLLEKIYMVISDVAEKEGFTLVLRGEVVIYGSHTADLTPSVVKELDSRSDEIVRMFATSPEPASSDAPTSPTETIGRLRRPVDEKPQEILPLVP